MRKPLRRPSLYLLVVPPIFLGGSCSLLILLIDAYSDIRGVPRNAIPNLNGLLITIPALILWIPTSLFLANIVLYLVPSFRRIAEGYAARAEAPGMVETPKFLLMVVGASALVCIPLMVLGFAL